MIYYLGLFFVIILLLGICAPKRVFASPGESPTKLRREIESLLSDLKRLKRFHAEAQDEEVAQEQYRRMCEIQRKIDHLRDLIEE